MSTAHNLPNFWPFTMPDQSSCLILASVRLDRFAASRVVSVAIAPIVRPAGAKRNPTGVGVVTSHLGGDEVGDLQESLLSRDHAALRCCLSHNVSEGTSGAPRGDTEVGCAPCECDVANNDEDETSTHRFMEWR
jgi:hypothetical protein